MYIIDYSFGSHLLKIMWHYNIIDLNIATNNTHNYPRANKI